MKATTFFTDEEKERIKATTRSVESRTDGEIAVMVVDKATVIWKPKSWEALFLRVFCP